MSRELMKIFGPLWSEGVVEGKFLGLGRKRKFRVEWTSFHPHVIGEYEAQHSIFKDDQDTLVPNRARFVCLVPRPTSQLGWLYSCSGDVIHPQL